MASILIVDDGSTFDQGVAGHLEAAKHLLVVVHDTRHAQERLVSGGCNILLLNIALDRHDLCCWVRSHPRLMALPIICVSRQDALSERLQYFQRGVDDFLVVPLDGCELAARIEIVLRRARPRPHYPVLLAAAGGRVKLDVHRRTVIVNDSEFSLTRLEYLVLYHLMQVAGQSVSTEELLEQVWGYGGGSGDPALVRAQVKNLRRKLASTDQKLRWLRTVPGLGYQIEA